MPGGLWAFGRGGGGGFERGRERARGGVEAGELLGEEARGLGVLAKDQAVREEHLAEIVADVEVPVWLAAEVTLFVVEQPGGSHVSIGCLGWEVGGGKRAHLLRE